MLTRALWQITVCAGLLAVVYGLPDRPKPFRGPVVRATNQEVVLSLAGEEVSFFAPYDVTVTLNGESVALAALGPQVEATVWAERQDRFWVLRQIEAESSAKSAALPLVQTAFESNRRIDPDAATQLY